MASWTMAAGDSAYDEVVSFGFFFAPALASLSAASLPGMPLCPRTCIWNIHKIKTLVIISRL